MEKLKMNSLCLLASLLLLSSSAMKMAQRVSTVVSRLVLVLLWLSTTILVLLMSLVSPISPMSLVMAS